MFREHSMLVKGYSGARRTSLAFLEEDVVLVRELPTIGRMSYMAMQT